MQKLRQAIEAWDHAAIEAMLADNVSFKSPAAFKAFEGKALTAAILRGVGRVFHDFRYTTVHSREDARNHALVFEAVVDGRSIRGCDFVHVDEDGLIDDFEVMVRPLSAVIALSSAMEVEFEQIRAEMSAEGVTDATSATPSERA